MGGTGACDGVAQSVCETRCLACDEVREEQVSEPRNCAWLMSVLPIGGTDRKRKRPLDEELTVGSPQTPRRVVDIRRFGTCTVQFHNAQVPAVLEGVDISIPC